MTRVMMEVLLYGSLAISFPVSGYVIYWWARKVWPAIMRGNVLNLNRLLLYISPGLVMMLLVFVPSFYISTFTKADNFCINVFSMNQPSHKKNLSGEELKQDRLETMKEYCPMSDYDDLFSRLD